MLIRTLNATKVWRERRVLNGSCRVEIQTLDFGLDIIHELPGFDPAALDYASTDRIAFIKADEHRCQGNHVVIGDGPFVAAAVKNCHKGFNVVENFGAWRK